MKHKLLLKNVILMMFFTLCYANAQTGYIYVHKKAISEVASLDFPFTLTGPSSYSKTFSLNDKPDALNAFDLGNSHGAGEGQLWAVINDGVNDGTTHVTNGTLYTRPTNSQQWAATNVTNARSVDGIDANTAVYCNNAGAVFLYNATTNTSTSIGNPATIIDVASGGTGGLIVAVGSNGTLYRYSGTGTTWSAYTNTNVANVYRVDVNPTNQDVVFIRTNNQTVYRLAGGGAVNAVPSTIAAPTGTSSAGNDLRDIAISNNGTIYSNFTNSTSNSANIYEYTSSWVDNPTSRSFSGITAGAGTQSWSINKVNPDQIKHSIFTSTSLSTVVAPGLWLDDERVRTTVANGNSIMIPVPSGTYTLTETVNPAWSNSEIKIYDPTNNSSSSSSTTTINVAAGEVVNVVYSNSLKNTVVIPAICGVNNIVTFGSGTATNGPAINGFTAYHYVASGGVSDGYYSVVKSKNAWYNNNPPLTNHTGDTNGYYGIFNASYATDDFFRQTVTGLAPNTTYEFAFWVANLSASGTNEIKPNVTMGINVGGVISSINTNDITSNTWIQYKFNFTTNSTITTSDTAEIFLKNNSIGGVGNDLAIDDVSFAPAPPIVPQSTGPTGVTVFCSTPSTSYQFTNTTPNGVWSTNTPGLINVSASGLVTTVAGASGTANVIYMVSSSSGCSTTITTTITIGSCACYNNPNTLAGSDTTHGITLLKRAGGTTPSSWPMNRKSAYTVLESNTKGLVITRMTSDPLQSSAVNYIDKITNPQEGMIIYDTFTKCLKIYDGTNWKCYSNPACP